MRCKNCGAENDDNRYICENCGSPLYDEEDLNTAATDKERTQTFKAVRDNSKNSGRKDYGSDYEKNSGRRDERREKNDGKSDKSDKDKKNIIVIVVLAVILAAIIITVAVLAHNNRSESETSSEQLTKYSSTSEDVKSTSSYSKSTAKEETETETTTEKTTESTTETLWIINTSSSGGGEAEGDGKYENGKTVTLIARADDGYVFDGWYSDGVKVSSDEEYSFKANENASFSAVFTPIETEAPSSEDSSETSADNEVVFGE